MCIYTRYIFVWIQHSCLANRVFAWDSSNSDIRRLSCIMVEKSALPRTVGADSTRNTYIFTHLYSQYHALHSLKTTNLLFIY